MKAVYYESFGGPEVLRIGDLPVPEPADDEVLVRVAAAGVNPIDRRLRNGELQEYLKRIFPVIPGWDLAGRIVKVGKRVSGWAVGDEVVGLAFDWTVKNGTYAEYAPVKASAIAHKPAEIPFTVAAGLPLVSLTAWESLAEYAELKPDQAILIQAGAGGVGCVAIPIAKHLGAKVYTTARSANAAFVRQRGADHVIDYTQEHYADVLRQLEPQGLDAVLETLTGEEVVRQAILLVRPGGTVIYMNNEPPDMPEIAERRIRTKFLHHRPDGESLSRLMQLYASGTLPLPPVEVLPLEQAAEAHRRSEAGHTRGKLVLSVQDL